MPTYAELETEAVWRAEREPPNLRIMLDAVRAHYKVGFTHVSARGDNNHTWGYHRSRAWILGSRFSAYRGEDYSVLHPLDRGGDANWYTGFDINPGSGPELIAMCKRLDVAVRAGKLEKLREWYGNFDGDQRVDGWDNILDRVATSDSSHLYHLHGSIFRAHGNDDHSDLLGVLIGSQVQAVFAMGMMLLAKDEQGNHWLCDGMTRRKVHPDHVDDIQYLGRLGAISLWPGNAETANYAPKGVWPNVSDVFGTPQGNAPAAVVDVDAIANRVADVLKARL